MEIPASRSRRRFMGASSLASIGGLNLLTSRKATARTGHGTVIGGGEHQYEVILWRDEAMRRNPDEWVSGKFIHPHDACFDADGNIFVAEWVASGRISKLRKV